MGEVARVSQIVCVWRLPSTRSSKVPAPVVTSTTAKYPDIVRLTASIRKVIFNTQRVSPCWIKHLFWPNLVNLRESKISTYWLPKKWVDLHMVEEVMLIYSDHLQSQHCTTE